MDSMVLHNHRPDAAVKVIMQLVAGGEPDVAAAFAAAPVRSGRLLSLCALFDWLMTNAHITVAGSLFVEMARMWVYQISANR